MTSSALRLEFLTKSKISTHAIVWQKSTYYKFYKIHFLNLRIFYLQLTLPLKINHIISITLSNKILHNLKTHNLQLVVKHNDDFDSELTDFEEEAELAKVSSIKISNNNNNTNQKNKNITISSIKVDDDSDSEDTKSDFNNNSDHKKSAKQEAHRSIRLNELNLVLKEPPGSLTKTLFDVIKSMTSSSSTVNPNSLFSAVCKKLVDFKSL